VSWLSWLLAVSYPCASVAYLAAGVKSVFFCVVPWSLAVNLQIRIYIPHPTSYILAVSYPTSDVDALHSGWLLLQ